MYGIEATEMDVVAIKLEITINWRYASGEQRNRIVLTRI